MTDSQTSDVDSAPDAGDGRSPRYDQVRRWAAYIDAHPPAVWGSQQNAVVNGQLESAQAVGVSAEERARVREFADAVLGAKSEGDDEPDGRGE
jgi:hypothetical protein